MLLFFSFFVIGEEASQVMKNAEIEQIYDLYIDDLYSYALHLGFNEDAIMDAIHDVFLNISRAGKDLYEIGNVKLYLFRSLKNQLINLRRSRIKMIPFPSESDENELPFDIRVTLDEPFALKEEYEITRRKIEEMLSLLTPRQREIIYLRFTMEYDYDQIAQIMNLTVPSCRKLVHYAIQTIRKNYPHSLATFFWLVKLFDL